MPIMFDFHVTFTVGECGYAWNFNSDGFLYLAKSPGEQFVLTNVTDDPQYGSNVYAIQSVSYGKYLALASDGKKIVANSASPEKSLLLRAEPTNGDDDPFLWEVASTGDYLHVSVNQADFNFILADGTAAGSELADCQFRIVATASSTVVS